MKVIRYRIHLLEPTLVGTLGGEPNSAAAFDYLPGSVLRGAIIGKYIQARKAQNTGYEFDAHRDDERRLFVNGSSRYLNGYRLDREGRRALPTPLSWQQKKGEDNEIFDFAVAEQSLQEQWEGVRSSFCVLPMEEEAKAGFVRPERHLAVHTQRTRRFGRAMPAERIDADEDNEGAVYRYDALAAGQTFEAAILCDLPADAMTLIPLLQGSVLVGGSRSGGYGKAELRSLATNADQNEKDELSWREIHWPFDLSALSTRVIVTLLSDALLRDDSGQSAVNARVVRDAVGQRLSVAQLQLSAERGAFYRAEMTGGFNRKWGLPLPQVQAVAMGSVFAFDTPACSLHDWQILEAQGIGERRAEGFGRITVNWQTETMWKVEEDQPTPTAPVSLAAGTASAKIAEQMVMRMARRRLDESLVQRANDLGENIRTPRPSQLSRLRMVIQDALREALSINDRATDSEVNAGLAAGRQRLSEYCYSLEKRQFTLKQFTRDYVEGKPLLGWLRWRIDDQSEIWTSSQLNIEPLPEIGGVKARLDSPMLAFEYNLRLMDAVLARSTKLIQKEDRG